MTDHHFLNVEAEGTEDLDVKAQCPPVTGDADVFQLLTDHSCPKRMVRARLLIQHLMKLQEFDLLLIVFSHARLPRNPATNLKF